jgi:hypothetical protein
MHLYLPLYLGLVFLIPWDPSRYVTTTVPFLLYFYVEAAASLGWSREGALARFLGARPPVRVVAMSLAAGLVLLSVGAGAARIASFARHRAFNDALLPPALVQRQTDQAALAAWGKATLPADALWVHERDPLIYLLTGRQAFSYVDGPDPTPQSVELFEAHPCYMVLFTGPEFKTTHRALVTAHPDKVKRVFQSGEVTVYQVARDW